MITRPPIRGRGTRLAAAWVAIGLVAAALTGALSHPAPVTAAGDTLRMEPSTSVVAKDSTVRLRVIQNASVPTSGAQATIVFDPRLLQLKSVAKGSDYATAPILAGADTAAIASANASGTLKGVAAAFLPPGAAGTGDKEFLALEFTVVSCGRAEISMPVGQADAALLDGRPATYGDQLAITASGATITACDTLRIDPPSNAASTGSTVRLGITQNAAIATGGARATVTFDPALLQLTSVTKGKDYAGAAEPVGATAEAIAAANASGSLERVTVALAAPASIAAGDRESFVLEFKALACGTAEVGLPAADDRAALLDGRAATYGQAVTVTGIGAVVEICDTMRVEPAISTAEKDGTVAVKVVHNAEVAASGAQATIEFDPGLLQLISVAKGSDYAAAAIFAGADAASISEANRSGALRGIAAAFLPPGAVEAGDRAFLVVTFKAIGCGRATILLADGPDGAGLLDGRAETYGAQLLVTPITGTVTICTAPVPTPTPSPTRSPTPSPTRSPAPAPTVAPYVAAPVVPYVPPAAVPAPAGEVLGASTEPTVSEEPVAMISSSSPEPVAVEAGLCDGCIGPIDGDMAAIALVGGGVVGLTLALAALVTAAVAIGGVTVLILGRKGRR